MDSKALMNRRTAIGAGGAALAGLLVPGRVLAQGQPAPSNPFVLLLNGLYQPVVHGPNLGLSAVDLSDGSYSTTKIYPVSGMPGNQDPSKAIGNFYGQFTGDLCAYHIPGGSLAMQFTFVDDKIVDPPPSDGQGGTFFRGTLELNILEATGVYRSFAGGHNHMVDNLHLLANGDADEFCYCNISRP